MPFLSVHFKEKTTPDGEQVHFAVSRNGLDWEQVNGGRPVLTAEKGEKGCRDIEIVRLASGGFVILTTDLAIARRAEKGPIDWKYINSHGSKMLRMWRSEDLVHFSDEELLYFGRDDLGCLWAPEVFYDGEAGEYLIHWGSTAASDGFSHMRIYACRTRDFRSFTKPEVFFEKDTEILDSHLVKHDQKYYLFYKDSRRSKNMLSTCPKLYGEYVNDPVFEAFTSSMPSPGAYEGPTTFVLPDGRWCLMLDFFGCEKEKMGYVPFVSARPGDVRFARSEEFSFPYGFKHGKVIEISEEEYVGLQNRD
ncbi:MAG: glycoside hydrolase family 43 protein [Clostridia bacterium]|nr:glycoside hydrolase family 43 protein [Clostridia bacterium]